MSPEFYIFIAVYITAAAYAFASVLKSRVGAVELPPEVLSQRVKHSATLLSLLGRILRITIVNLTTFLILASIVAASLMAAMAYGETRTELVEAIDEAVPGHLVLVKLSKPTSRYVVESALRPLLVEKVALVSYLYRVILERGLRVDGLPGVRWVIVGVDGPLAHRLNIAPDTLITGCAGQETPPGNMTGLKIVCAEPSLQKLKIAPLETLLPVLGYIGTEPLTPSLDMVLISRLETAVKVLNLDDALVTDVLMEGLPLSREAMEEMLTKLNVDVIYYYHATTVLVVGSAKIITVDAVISTLLTVLSCAILVAIAYRSLIPEFKAINEKLRYVGLPQWGIAATLTMHMLLSALLGTVTSATLTYFTLSMKQAAVSAAVSMLSIAIAAITLLREVGTGTLSYGAYTPAPDRYEMVLPAQKVGSLRRMVDMIRRAIETNEFFEVESVSDKLWDHEAVVYFRVAYREMWGISLSGLIGITSVNSMVRLFIEVDVSSIEELSENVYNSIRALFISKLVGEMRVDLELEN